MKTRPAKSEAGAGDSEAVGEHRGSISRLNLGAKVSDSGVHYEVWAPSASLVYVEVVPSGGAERRIVHTAATKSGVFKGTDLEGAAGDLYHIWLDSSKKLPDPASRYQPQGVHGPSMVIDPRTFEWQDHSWKRPKFRELVIYELHIGTFTKEGSFASAIEKLEHLRDLGVTAIQIMPIAEFAGSRNWGYDGVYPFAPCHAYGHPDELRRLVDSAHQRGLAVILDVVYNHWGPDGNYLQEFVGNYLDEECKTPWGGAVRYGDESFGPLREMILSNPVYWIEEFHVDGFRLDATHAIFDDSPRHLLQELTAIIRSRGGYAIAEDPRNESRMIVPEEQGGVGFDAVWADDFHHVVRVGNTGEQESYLGDFKGSREELVGVLQHGWLYRGQFAASQGKARGTECCHLCPEHFVHCISNHDQVGNHPLGLRLAHRAPPAAIRAADALICLSPYTPMLFMGQEWAASTPFQFFTDHNEDLGRMISQGRKEEFKHFAAFNEPGQLDRLPDPQSEDSFENSKLIWEEVNVTAHAQSLALYKACLRLRNRHGEFRPADRKSWRICRLEGGACALRLHAATSDWLIVFDLWGGGQGSLRGESIVAPVSAWEMVLSSNEHRFGGNGLCALSCTHLTFNFEMPELILLRSILPLPPEHTYL